MLYYWHLLFGYSAGVPGGRLTLLPGKKNERLDKKKKEKQLSQGIEDTQDLSGRDLREGKFAEVMVTFFHLLCPRFHMETFT